MTSYNTLDATRCAEAIQDGKLDPRQLTESCLSRISDREDEVGAWINLNEDYINAQLVDELADIAGNIPAPVVQGFLKTLLGQLG